MNCPHCGERVTPAQVREARQPEVRRMRGEGLSTMQIARALKVSKATVHADLIELGLADIGLRPGRAARP